MSSAVTARDTLAAPPRVRTRVSLKRYALAGAAIIAIGAGLWYGEEWWADGRFIESTDDAYVGGDVTALAAHVPGTIEAVLVGDNERVHAGEVLIRLDQRDYRAAEDRAEAAMRARRAALDSLRAQLVAREATVEQEQADLNAKAAQADFAAQDANRYRALASTAAGSRQDAQRSAALDQQARSAVLGAAASLRVARQGLVVLQADFVQAEAEIAAAEADLRMARLNLGWTDIRAPIDGYVGNRSAQVGAYASAGSYLISVVPSSGLWVDANFKEDQLGRIAAGRPARIVADVLPDHVFHGHVETIAPGTGGIFSVIPPENATGNFTKIVQRVPVRVLLDPGDPMLGLLRPGLSTITSVDTRADHERGAVK